ncbi:TetR/AcrR family transcriptional regulator [Streptomyces sp. NBC_01343]|uniref:TetR/AcrR family transcriptional regulator n=1 Tax=Streptomyces sp. NBC_01343 TaxID=2903832 RepID=UPI002E11A9D0|nr:TetR/AcrR family transcriptional regulator [Streptomyces sp. NBC_01343]
MTPATERPAPVRRDARRNRELLLAAARKAFAAQGLDAPLDEIARRAGVGNATLYRHFPTRAALIDAVFQDSLQGTVDAGEAARGAADAWTGLAEYLEAVFTVLAADRGANDLMTTAIEGVTSLDAVHAHNHGTIALLMDRAQRDGTMRSDVTVEDLLLSLATLGRAVPSLAAAGPPHAWRRQLALFLDALRAGTRPATPLPAPALTAQDLEAVLHDLGPHRGS